MITPEAVVLDVHRAGPGTRIAARGLDYGIQAVMLFVLFILLGIGAQGSSGGVVFIVVSLVGTFLIVFGYPAILEATWRGRTFGKAAFGLRVVTKEGAPIRFRHAAIRSALFLIDGLLLGPTVGILCLLLTRDTVRVGDMVAGTMVIRERSGAGSPAPAVFSVPYGYEGYVATLDVSGLLVDDYGLVRSYLMRAPQLTPQVRYSLAAELATPITSKMRVPIPSIHPEAFLVCVAAAWQQRHGWWPSGPGLASPVGGLGPAGGPLWPAPTVPPPSYAPAPSAAPPPPAATEPASTAQSSGDAGFVPPS